jgi:glycosyltransferase involved in cell wall biosynthesis
MKIRVYQRHLRNHSHRSNAWRKRPPQRNENQRNQRCIRVISVTIFKGGKMNIGFVSTRLAGTDGVSLETAKLAAVLRAVGHQIYYCAGEMDGDVDGLLDPRLHFEDPTAVAHSRRAFQPGPMDEQLLADIAARAEELEKPLRQFIRQYDIHFLIVQNALSIPMQLPLGQALAAVLQETNLSALAHNHDLYWERERFLQHRLGSFLDSYFPPDLPNLRHAVINSAAGRALKERRGLNSTLIPNVFDFDTPPPSIDDYNADFRQAIGLVESDWLILQPTRIIPRKGIELAIELLARLNEPRAKLVITHRAGDEGLDYLHALQQQAAASGVDLRSVADMVDDQRRMTADGRKVYSLWDVYPHADFVTYPSLIEGFGNALLETIYFKRPALVNRYPVYAEDIAPLGFQFVEIDGQVTDEAVAAVRGFLEHPEKGPGIVEHNYHLAQEHYSYRPLSQLLAEIIG